MRQTFTACPAGTYNPTQGAADSSACVDCMAGKANSIPGSSEAAPRPGPLWVVTAW